MYGQLWVQGVINLGVPDMKECMEYWLEMLDGLEGVDYATGEGILFEGN